MRARVIAMWVEMESFWKIYVVFSGSSLLGAQGQQGRASLA